MNNKPKVIALTTKTLCNRESGGSYSKYRGCPSAMGRWFCREEKKKMKIDKKGRPVRSDKCKDRFPGVIVMTSLKGGK